MNSQPKVLFYVQHLLGIGHVFRATRVARALAAVGARVHLAWGGTRLPSFNLDGLEVTFLDPARTESEHFSRLVHPDGSPVMPAELDARRDKLLALFYTLRPDIVVTEAFPFGRRQMRFELVPLMEATSQAPWRPLAVSSIRDIMQEGRAENRVRESIDAFRNWYDLALVHGDPDIIRIEDTLQEAGEILDRVRYTGLVAPEPVDLSIEPSIAAEVVVSSGGGAVGHALTAAAIGAQAHCRTYPENWLLVVGPERSESDFAELKALAGAKMRVERFVPDLARVLAGAKVSVSRAGYNTVGDLLRARCRVVLVPFAGGRETEQLRRAQLFSAKGLAIMLRDEELTPKVLAQAVDEAAQLPLMEAGIDLDGASRSAEILMRELELHHARSGGTT